MRVCLVVFIFIFTSLAAEFKTVEQLSKSSKVLSVSYSMCEKLMNEKGFEWTSDYKKSKRTTKPLMVFGERSIESIIHFNKKRVSKIELLYYSKADSKAISASEFSKKTKTLGKGITKSIRAKSRKKLDALKNVTYQWRKGSTKYSLEVIDRNSSGKSLEYIRLTIQSAKNKRVKFYSHNELQRKVKKRSNGDVYISRFPMVDQGKKGYCVCASLSRVLQHFGRDVDQHEVARMAKSGKQGTSYKDIKTTLVELAPQVYVTYRKIGDFALMPVMDLLYPGELDFDGDVNERYKRAILKEARRGRHSEGWRGICEIIYNVMDSKKDDFKRNERAIYNAIDLGRPIAWTLMVGFYPEKNIKEGEIGGHMRLIIGYNREKGEIIYTDTWGKGHEFKRISTRTAMMATTAMWELRPKL